MITYTNETLINDLTEIAMNKESHEMFSKIFEKHDIQINLSNDRTETFRSIQTLVNEISLDGGNTIVNVFRGLKGVPYLELACDAAEKIGIEKDVLEKCKDISEFDNVILLGAIKKYFDKCSEEERTRMFNELNTAVGLDTSQKIFQIFTTGTPAAMIAVIEVVGQQVIRKALVSVLSQIVARQAALNAGRIIALAVPFINILMGCLIVLDIAGPAYRKTIPTTIMISMLRLTHAMDKSIETGGF